MRKLLVVVAALFLVPLLASSLAAAGKSAVVSAGPAATKGENFKPTHDVLSGAGGPDGYGYMWIDSDTAGGPAYDWVGITSFEGGSGTNTGMGGDDQMDTINMSPFGFPFYDGNFDLVYVSSNGFLSFTYSGYAYPTNQPLPFASITDGLFPFWDDMNLALGGSIWYWYDSANVRFIVEFYNVMHFASGGPYTFEVILNADGSIVYQYKTMNTPRNQATVGIQGVDGSSNFFLQYYYDGLPFSNEVHDNLAVRFAFQKLEHDVKAVNIIDPAATIDPGSVVNIRANVLNYGLNPESFDVGAQVESAGVIIYQDYEIVSDLDSGDVTTVSFSEPWYVPSGEGLTYEVSVFTLLMGDMNPANDTVFVLTRAMSVEKLCIDDGVMVNAHAHWLGGDAWGVQYTPPMYPALIESVQVYVLSEGDPYWPWPDNVHQPFAICVWDESAGQPGTEVFRDTVQADATPPSWVMAYPDVVINSGDFWVGTEQFLDNPTCEGMGVDAAYDNGPQNWFRIAGTWTQDPGLTGDLMMCAFVSPAAARDVHPDVIDSPGGLVMPGVPVTPMVTLSNTGDSIETFYTLFLVDSAGVNVYTDSVQVTTLMPDSVLQVSFPDWTPDGQGNVYDLRCITNSPVDEMMANDTLTGSTMAFLVDSLIVCGWASFAPSIDGIISISEWMNADVVDISDILAEGSSGVAPNSVILYAMNDATHLFLAVDYLVDANENVNDRVTVFLDENNDDAWAADSSEGNYWAFRSSGGPRFMYRPLPTGPFTDPIPGSEIGMACLINMTYEFSIPFGTAKYELDVSLGDTMGMHMYAHDQGIGQAEGWWMQTMDAANQSVPAYYGHIVLHLLDAVTEGKTVRAANVFGIMAANPSPFSRTSSVRYCIDSPARVTLQVYDASGRVVRTLLSGAGVPGIHEASWDGRDDSGRELSSGVYFYSLACGGRTSCVKSVLLR